MKTGLNQYICGDLNQCALSSVQNIRSSSIGTWYRHISATSSRRFASKEPLRPDVQKAAVDTSHARHLFAPFEEVRFVEGRVEPNCRRIDSDHVESIGGRRE